MLPSDLPDTFCIHPYFLDVLHILIDAKIVLLNRLSALIVESQILVISHGTQEIRPYEIII